MADLRIVDAPLLPTLKGTEKLPTGGEGNFSVSIDQVADFAKLKWVLATEGYVDTAVNGVRSELVTHVNAINNPHQVTKAQVGLGNVDNTADVDKPIGSATQAALATLTQNKADKTYVDTQLNNKADKATTYSKTESDSLLANKSDVTYVNTKYSSHIKTFLNTGTALLNTLNGEYFFIISSDSEKVEDLYLNVNGVATNQNKSELSSLLQHNSILGRDVSGAHQATSISTANGLSQQEINDFGGSKWYSKLGGYDLGATVTLSNGNKVKSTIPNNITNPNIGMTGWVLDGEFHSVQSKLDLSSLKVKIGTSVFVIDEQSIFIADDSSSFVDGFIVISSGGYFWKRQTNFELKLSWFLNPGESAHLAFPRIVAWLDTLPAHYTENSSPIHKIKMDLCGKVWESSAEILVNNRLFSGLTFTNGSFKASDSFVGTYLLRMQHDSVSLAFYYTYFNDVIFDGNRVASCVKANNFLKCGFSGTCQFLRWKENGIGLLIGSTLDEQALNPNNVHEVIGDQLVFMQYNFEDIVTINPSTGTALINACPDGHISNVVVASSGKGILNLRAGLNMYDKVHVYGLTEPDYGFWMDNTDVNFESIHLNSLYLDGCSLYVLNPRQLSVANSTIFRHDENLNGLIIMEANQTNTQVSRFVSTLNTFNTVTAGRPEIEFKTSGSGSWNKVQNIQSYGNMYFGLVVAFKASAPDTQESWLKMSESYSLLPRYPMEQSGTFTFDVKPYHNLGRGVGASTVLSEWILVSSYQSDNSDVGFGLYKLFIAINPSGNYSYQVQQIGTKSGGFSTGFDAEPTVSSNGTISVSLSAFWLGAVYRVDSRNVVGI